jgi:hypothetical protein
MHRINQILVIYIFSFQILNSQIIPQDSSSNNVGVLLGVGPTFGGLGLSLEYEQRINKNVFVTPYASVGIEFGNIGWGGDWNGYCIGVNVEFGRIHRMIGGLAYGTHGIAYASKLINEADTSSNDKPGSKLNLGPSLIIGYKGVSPFGITWLVYLGIAHENYISNETELLFFRPISGIGIGYRF